MSVDLLSFLQEHLHNTKLIKHNLHADCPFCYDQKHHFSVSLQHGVWNCWKCGDQHTSKTIYNLCKHLGVQLPRDLITSFNIEDLPEPEKIQYTDIQLPDYKLFTNENLSTLLGQRAFQYLLARGIDYERIVQDGIGYCSSGPFAYRVIIPMTVNHKVVYFQARDFIGRSTIKYLNAEVSREAVLGNYDYVEGDTCILVEGFFGAIHVNGIALLGRTISDGQIALLKRKQFSKFIILLDGWKPDADTRINTANIADKLKGIASTYVIYLPKGAQPDNFSQFELFEFIKDATKWTLRNKLLLRI